MLLYRVVSVVTGLLALAAVGLIVAAILGVHVILLAIGTPIAMLAAAGWASTLEEKHKDKLRVEHQQKQQIELRKGYERKRERLSLDQDCQSRQWLPLTQMHVNQRTTA